MKTKFKHFVKKCVSLTLFFAILACCASPGIVNAETGITGENQKEEISDFLKIYFSDLLDTVKADSDKDYSHEDFASVKGYIVAKLLVNERQIYKKLLGGIEEVGLSELTVDDVFPIGDKIEAATYVKYFFTYEGEKCFTGSLYKVTLSKNDGIYRVLDLDNDGEETRMAKEAILGSSDLRKEVESKFNAENARGLSNAKSEIDYYVADAYFEEAEQNTESLLRDDIKYADEKKEDDEKAGATPASAPPASASTDQGKEGNRGYELGDDRQNYIFKRASLDCANFVFWRDGSGHGGADGLTTFFDLFKEDPAGVSSSHSCSYRNGLWYFGL